MPKKSHWDNKETAFLLGTILELRNIGDAKRFFRDLLTEAELREFANRWKVARMLDGGDSYVAIEEETGMSSTTIARIQKWLKKGEGGYRAMLRHLSR